MPTSKSCLDISIKVRYLIFVSDERELWVRHHKRAAWSVTCSTGDDTSWLTRHYGKYRSNQRQRRRHFVSSPLLFLFTTVSLADLMSVWENVSRTHQWTCHSSVFILISSSVHPPALFFSILSFLSTSLSSSLSHSSYFFSLSPSASPLPVVFSLPYPAFLPSSAQYQPHRLLCNSQVMCWP